MKFDTNRLILTVLGLFSLGIVALVLFLVWDGTKTHRLTIAAGSAKAESYVLAQALKSVVEQHRPKIRITVRETGGTSENIRLLEERQADLVTAQADVPAGPNARSVAVLFEDRFQLLVHENTGIQTFADLRHRKIALPRTGGQYKSFLEVAEHFGLSERDFEFLGRDDPSADVAFQTGEADAAFRVRALTNPTIIALARSGKARVLPIPQGAAMQIKLPALRPGVIPEGAYNGDPPIPPADVPTVGVQRTLLAHRDVDADAIRDITEILIERRQEIAAAIPDSDGDVRPLLAGIQRPDLESGLGPTGHPGAISYYDKDKPNWVLDHGDFFALILTVVLLIGSWIWELKRWIERRQKNNADVYNQRVVILMNRALETTSRADIDEIRRELYAIIARAVQDLDIDKITDESFQSFRAVWQIAAEVVRDRRASLKPPVKIEPAATL